MFTPLLHTCNTLQEGAWQLSRVTWRRRAQHCAPLSSSSFAVQRTTLRPSSSLPVHSCSMPPLRPLQLLLSLPEGAARALWKAALWGRALATAPQPAAAATAAHREADTSFDVIVVGGGIAGSCTAYELQKRGLRVALLEQHDFLHRRGSRCVQRCDSVLAAGRNRVASTNRAGSLLTTTAVPQPRRVAHHTPHLPASPPD